MQSCYDWVLGQEVFDFFLIFQIFCIDYYGVCKEDSVISSFLICLTLITFSSLTAFRTSRAMLRSSAERKHACLDPEHSRKALNSSVFNYDIVAAHFACFSLSHEGSFPPFLVCQEIVIELVIGFHQGFYSEYS